MDSQIANVGRQLRKNLANLLPVVLLVAGFQALVVRHPLPDIGAYLFGLLLLLVGLTLFVRGLAMSLFPLGEGLAGALAGRGSLWLLLLFAFALGFGSTVAEPALMAVTDQAAATMADSGHIAAAPDTVHRYSLLLRYVAATGLGLALLLGMLRILRDWPLAWFIVGGYALATVILLAGDARLAGIAFDVGVASTSAINIPLIVALGVGLASSIRGRQPLVDGFGIVALASLMPTLLILLGAVIIGAIAA